MIQLKLLGPFAAASAEGRALAVAGQRPQALLAYLAMPAGRVRPRAELAALLWGQGNDERARHSLSQALTRLRGWLAEGGADPLVASRDEVMLDAGAVQVDADEIAHLAREGTPAALARAAALWRGDFLEGIDLKAEPFEDWLLARRHELRETAIGVFERLARLDDPEQAIAAARRLLALAPLDESAHRRLIGLHLAAGRADLALLQYERCRDLLRRELGTAPDPATLQLQREALRLARRPAPAAIAPAPAAAADAELAAAWAGAAPPVPDRPSIAVLPFENRSAEADQDFVSDGITEEIITELSRFRSLFVIARNSSFAYKGQGADPKEIGQALGVRYLLQGSVRKAGGRVRITGQLVDGASGVHLWAERFEGGLEDIFDLQDQVTAAVVGAIAPKLEQAEIERAKRKSTESLDAYDYFLRGMAGVHRWSRHENAAALDAFYRAMELDPDFASAYGMASRCYLQRKVSGWVVDRAKETAEAERLARRAAELGKDDAVALAAAGMALSYVVGRHDEGGALIERGLRLNPNLAWAWLFSGWVRVWGGEPDEAIQRLAKAMRLSPNDSQIFSMQAAMAAAHFFAGRYAESFSWAQRARGENPDFLLATATAAASGALAGEPKEAASALRRLLQGEPTLSLSNLRAFYPIRKDEDLARWAEGMRRAGLT